MKILIAFLLLSLVACYDSISTYGKHSIVAKYPVDKPCFCTFYYSTVGDDQSFEDSCSKYNVGDTLHFK